MAAVSTLPNGRALGSRQSNEGERRPWDFVRPASQDVSSYYYHADICITAFTLSVQHDKHLRYYSFTFVAPMLICSTTIACQHLFLQTLPLKQSVLFAPEE